MSSISVALSALSQLRQNKRILRLSFPHNDGPAAMLLPNKLEADESLSRDFSFRVELLADDARIPLKAVQGKMVTIELVRGDGSLRYFNGYVFEFRLTKTDGGLAHYSMLLKPWLAYLALRNDNYLFHGKTLREQTQAVFADYGTHPSWDCHLGGAETPVTMACQFEESDHNYLHRRWEEAGWLYWYEHTVDGHKLILSDNSTQAAPIDGAGPAIRFQRHAGAVEEDAIGDWSPVRRVTATQAALSSFNFKDPSPSHVNVPTLSKQGDVPAIESHEYVGAYGYANAGAGDAMAHLRMAEIEAGGKHFEAGGNSRYVMPGRWFRLSEHFQLLPDAPEDAAKSEFLILAAHHTASNNFLQQGEPADYHNELTCIRKAIPWHPGRGYNSRDTKILAPQTAIVVGPDGQDIHTDAYGRVRVQFHWDRVGANDEKSCAWVRVASAWAGAELGLSATPRKGQEVLIQWLDGNTDRPVITGRVFNQANMPPWRLAGQQALTGLRSRELTADGGNSAGGRSNHMVLDDTDGSIQAQLKSDHQHSQLSLGHINRIADSGGRQDSRGEGFALETEGSGALRSARGLLLSTDGRARAVGGTLSRDELVSCLEQALEIAKGMGQSAADHLGGKRDTQPQQDLSAAVEALGHGAGDEAQASGAAAAGQPVVAISGAGGIASATPKDQTLYAGHNLDTVAGRNQQHYAVQSILSTAGKDIEHFALEGDIRVIANRGKVVQQAQQNSMELTADKSLTLMSTEEHILMAADKHITLTSGGAYIKIGGGNIDIVCPGNLTFKSAARAFTGPGDMKTDMPKFDTGSTGRQFRLHRAGDKSNLLADHNYKITLDDGKVVEGRTGADGLTKLAESDAMRVANIRVWKDAV